MVSVDRKLQVVKVVDLDLSTDFCAYQQRKTNKIAVKTCSITLNILVEFILIHVKPTGI